MSKIPAKISIIMPVYNTDKYVGEAIESVLSQSFTDFECIIIDDGSTDTSYQICQQYAKKDQRIRLYQNEKNMGISFARNKLIELAETAYIAPQDSDDISENTRLQRSYDFLEEHTDYAVVSGNNSIINEEGIVIGRREYPNDIQNSILKKSPLSQASCMFRKEVFYEVGGYDATLNYAEDYDLWLRMYAAGYKMQNINADILKYRISAEQSKSLSLRETLKNTIFVQEKAISEYGLTASFGDRIYHFFEKLLLLFPDSLILFLFKKLEYKNAK